jgi:hypothetical protein
MLIFNIFNPIIFLPLVSCYLINLYSHLKYTLSKIKVIVTIMTIKGILAPIILKTFLLLNPFTKAMVVKITESKYNTEIL